jgi:hypothetical protein
MKTNRMAKSMAKRRLKSGRVDHERQCLNERGPRKSRGQSLGCTDADEHPE